MQSFSVCNKDLRAFLASYVQPHVFPLLHNQPSELPVVNQATSKLILSRIDLGCLIAAGARLAAPLFAINAKLAQVAAIYTGPAQQSRYFHSKSLNKRENYLGYGLR
jgi:hypothetical protein